MPDIDAVAPDIRHVEIGEHYIRAPEQTNGVLTGMRAVVHAGLRVRTLHREAVHPHEPIIRQGEEVRWRLAEGMRPTIIDTAKMMSARRFTYGDSRVCQGVLRAHAARLPNRVTFVVIDEGANFAYAMGSQFGMELSVIAASSTVSRKITNSRNGFPQL